MCHVISCVLWWSIFKNNQRFILIFYFVGVMFFWICLYLNQRFHFYFLSKEKRISSIRFWNDFVSFLKKNRHAVMLCEWAIVSFAINTGSHSTAGSYYQLLVLLWQQSQSVMTDFFFFFEDRFDVTFALKRYIRVAAKLCSNNEIGMNPLIFYSLSLSLLLLYFCPFGICFHQWCPWHWGV